MVDPRAPARIDIAAGAADDAVLHIPASPQRDGGQLGGEVFDRAVQRQAGDGRIGHVAIVAAQITDADLATHERRHVETGARQHLVLGGVPVRAEYAAVHQVIAVGDEPMHEQGFVRRERIIGAKVANRGVEVAPGQVQPASPDRRDVFVAIGLEACAAAHPQPGRLEYAPAVDAVGGEGQRPRSIGREILVFAADILMRYVGVRRQIGLAVHVEPSGTAHIPAKLVFARFTGELTDVQAGLAPKLVPPPVGQRLD